MNSGDVVEFEVLRRAVVLNRCVVMFLNPDPESEAVTLVRMLFLLMVVPVVSVGFWKRMLGGVVSWFCWVVKLKVPEVLQFPVKSHELTL